VRILGFDHSSAVPKVPVEEQMLVVVIEQVSVEQEVELPDPQKY
jgi:hypothetical protein